MREARRGSPAGVVAAALAGLAAAALLPAPAGAGSSEALRCAAPDAWREPAAWGRLERGLSRAQVVRILGDPGKTVSYAGFERWEYPDLLGGRVHFDDRGRVLSWRRPRDLRQ